MIERFKNITINGREFRIGLVTADVGNWIVLQMAAGKVGDPDVYQRIRDALFNLCSVYKETPGGKVPMRIFADGRWLVPDLDLEYDLDTVNSLFLASIEFNFAPFLAKRRKEEEERIRSTLSGTQATS